MKKTLTIILILITVNIFGQTNLKDTAQSIVAEGKLLYSKPSASYILHSRGLSRYFDGKK